MKTDLLVYSLRKQDNEEYIFSFRVQRLCQCMIGTRKKIGSGHFLRMRYIAHMLFYGSHRSRRKHNVLPHRKVMRTREDFPQILRLIEYTFATFLLLHLRRYHWLTSDVKMNILGRRKDIPNYHLA